MSLTQRFEAAATKIRSFTKMPKDEDLTEVYALYKQAVVGDINVAKPGLLDVKGKLKWDAWSTKKGMTSDAAKEAYIAKIEQLAVLFQ